MECQCLLRYVDGDHDGVIHMEELRRLCVLLGLRNDRDAVRLLSTQIQHVYRAQRGESCGDDGCGVRTAEFESVHEQSTVALRLGPY